MLNNNDQKFNKLSLIDLKPLRMYLFPTNCGDCFAYTPVDNENVLLISSSVDSKNRLQCNLIKKKGLNKLLEKQTIDLGGYLEENHKLGLVLKDGNVSYFAAFSKESVSKELFSVLRVLLIQSTY